MNLLLMFNAEAGSFSELLRDNPEVLTQFEATTSSITGIEKKMEKVGHLFLFFSNFLFFLFWLQTVSF